MTGTGNVQAPIVLPGVSLPSNFGFDHTYTNEPKRARTDYPLIPPGPKPDLPLTNQPGRTGHGGHSAPAGPAPSSNQSGQQRTGQQVPGLQVNGQQSATNPQNGQSLNSGHQSGQSFASGQHSGQSFVSGQQNGQSFSSGHQSGQSFASGQPSGQSFASGQHNGQSFASGQQNGQSFTSGQSFNSGQQSGQSAPTGQAFHHGQSVPGQAFHAGQSVPGQSFNTGQQTGQSFAGQQQTHPQGQQFYQAGQQAPGGQQFPSGQQFSSGQQHAVGQHLAQTHNPGGHQVYQQIYNTNHSGPVNNYNLSTLPSNIELRNLNVTDHQFREWFPNLGAMTFAHQMSTIQTLCAMELKASGKIRATRPQNSSLEDQFRENVQILTLEKTWEPEVDNRYNLLHSIRFDRAPIIGSEKIFQMAAERYKPGDIPPISAYDLSSLGLSDVVITAKG